MTRPYRRKEQPNLVKRPAVTQPDDQSVKLIPLTKGQVAIVDAEDYTRCKNVNWSAAWSKDAQTFYAIGCPYRGKGKVLMHRFILGETSPYHVDHWDRNGLNNRRRNLRYCTPSQNHANTAKRIDNSSGYKGVWYNRRRGVFQAYIKCDTHHYYLGAYADPRDAAAAYNEAAIQLFGEFAHLNQFN